MGIQPFDFEYWRDETRQDWQRLGLHWHCHAWRGDADDYGDEQARRDPSTELPPQIIKQWLDKPARTIRRTVTTPEEAIAWLRAQWEPIRGQIGPEATAIPEETRFGTALYDLRTGNDVCWGFWLGASTHLHLAIVGTAAACHARPASPGSGRPSGGRTSQGGHRS